MRKPLLVVLTVVLAIMHFFTLGKATNAAGTLTKGEGTVYVIPSPILKITTLEYDGLVSDFLFLKALVFVGSVFERTENQRILEWEWYWLHNVLEASAELDPYFFDPYYFANANLTWGGGLIRETNRLLEKGSRFRDWDWRLPLYLGFNNFFFLHENEKASEFLMVAARRPGGSPVFASIASKLAYKERRTENAILFLEEIVRKTANDELKKEYETRLDALRSISILERAVAAYREKFRKTPRKVDDLMAKKMITTIPKDPYGGTFYMDAQGSVRTTSEYKLMPAVRK